VVSCRFFKTIAEGARPLFPLTRVVLFQLPSGKVGASRDQCVLFSSTSPQSPSDFSLDLCPKALTNVPCQRRISPIPLTPARVFVGGWAQNRGGGNLGMRGSSEAVTKFSFAGVTEAMGERRMFSKGMANNDKLGSV